MGQRKHSPSGQKQGASSPEISAALLTLIGVIATAIIGALGLAIQSYLNSPIMLFEAQRRATETAEARQATRTAAVTPVTVTESASSRPSETPTSTPIPPIISSPTRTPRRGISALIIPVGHSSVNVDGICDRNAEYDDANSDSFPDSDQEGLLFYKHDGSFLYVCVRAALGTHEERRVSLEFAQSDNDSPIRIQVYPVTGATNASFGITGWSAAATTGPDELHEFAEFRVPISVTGGSPCYEVFKMAVFHYWVNAPADDYSWKNQPRIGFERPSIWPSVALECLP